MSTVTKDSVQAAARAALKAANYWGLVAAATGVGKSKIGVDEAAEVVAQDPTATVILTVPTQKLRDTNWLEEFQKWNQEEVYNQNISRYCYASIHKLKDEVIDLLILDEGHNLTELSAQVFSNNKVKRLLVLTATEPDKKGNSTDVFKVELFRKLKIPTVFEYSLDEAVRDGLVAPYEIRVVECNLDSTNKYIKAGSKAKPFYQTERQSYDYLTKIIRGMQFSGNSAAKWKQLARMRLIYNLKSKTEIARRIINRWIKPEERYIIFCGSIEQANSLCGEAVYHSKTNDKALEAFKRLELNKIGVVEALNEGHNLPEVDGAVMVQLNSNPRDLTQRIGRAIRFRPGHEAIIWVLVSLNCVDEDWFKKAIEPFDKTRITYLHYKNVI